MFEQEIEMEKRSSIVPLLLIIALIVTLVGGALYFVYQSRKVLTTAEAKPLVVSILDNLATPTLHFQTGAIKASVSEKPHDPHYRVLEKAGYLKIGKDVKDKTPVSLTPEGEAFLGSVVGVKKSKDKEGNDEYAVPLAQRKLVDISKITMVTPSKAIVEYSWNWDTTKAGDLFDAAGPVIKGFNTWDRTTLIDKYGANFYHEGPKKVTLALVKGDKGWVPQTD